ncbi:MAG: DoxX family protein [Cyclobacteriaceae bacterium]|nr:DoxX family protein [Cyclobacteriaceae bacterium]
MKVLDKIVAFLVGSLFIFSGLVKIDDPMGTQIKLGEYFEVFSSDFGQFFEWFIPFAMPIGFTLIVVEIVLGVALILHYRMKITIWALTVIISFFTFLTFYSAYFNKVTDCGCFGDAIPLTPWQSFTKDIILVVLIGYIFFRKNHLKPVLSPKIGLYTIIGSALVSIYIGFSAIRHLPPVDFRPYAIGDNIQYNMIPEEQPIFEYVFEKDGQDIVSEAYLTEKDGFTYKSHRITNEDKTIPKITDYNVWNEEVGDFTKQSLTGVKLFFISYNVNDASKGEMGDIVELVNSLSEIETIALTSSSTTDFEKFRHTYQLAAPYFYGDATVLKAMIRSNPGLMLFKDGTVLGKWHFNDVPRAEEVRDLLK